MRKGREWPSVKYPATSHLSLPIERIE